MDHLNNYLEETRQAALKVYRGQLSAELARRP
jgi:hypothetical protein